MTPSRPNVLFLSVDDMRPQLGCYGYEQMVTPNMDALAASGTRFARAFCNLPVCGPSRASVMTGLRPTPDRFMKRNCYAEVDAPHAVALNSHFRTHGYHTISNGKIFDQIADHADGWSETPWRANDDIGRHFDCYALEESLEAERVHKAVPPVTRGVHRGPAYECADVPDDVYTDGMTTLRAIDDLRRMADSASPWFMAVGFARPHLPFIAPQRYWDLYDHGDIELPHNYRLPEGVPEAADRDWNELRLYAGMPNEGPVPDEEARKVIHAYYACVSYVDALVGRILGELDSLGMTDDTVVVLWSDHGYNLGEHGMWCKHTTFETNMLVPLIVRSPGAPAGQESEAFIVLNDIYATLCELTGLPIPEHVEGMSFADIVRGEPSTLDRSTAPGRMYRAETLRTQRHRYTEFFDAATGDHGGTMLFDHERDPDETVSIADDPEASATVQRLGTSLRQSLHPDHPLRGIPVP